ncbi:MAG: bifunctional alpha,alpha-trehalose-phosphate synthase (UDP-forming)/trehalose-phosphatase [Prevotella sp.]|jgi:trehalose 6-phosphate synthase/phosphatase|nr:MULTISPECIES: bifunctional alpha,alpha-trehalose-phosphate synthase (UDP-forming)/trehalose-phosphatase [unclassified Prevotella]MCH3970864.1 bifunctional alpha,alpha-trehalose-phosphate synthase (UDP-forming)/trehalose-phosphatase [Prevotella sp.]MCH3985735.1 bifunctional alpha,alpha-trehalose-phosphate synthase (UDP-forming)/trehalose-phosphatase [Prevotella sp.]MCH3993300.1 bifunctional alpha,alpha-trehalose-phosphate synthase (UDP-forming)/trehalose-phosphatase [Prevotella sp.]MCH4186738
MKQKLYIVSNRLPLKATLDEEKGFTFIRSEGGLATGLNSLKIDYEKHWIGWPGMCFPRKKEQDEVRERLEAENLHPVFLSQSQYKSYYEGYCNSTLWPLCHYFYGSARYQKTYWESYKKVNQMFADEVCRLAGPSALVWVQDYQLMLVPAMLREKRPDLHIGFFLHIPFPSYELFRVLPERDHLLKGLLGADFIGFHTHDYLRHFMSSVERTLHLEFHLEEVIVNGRAVHVDALPMGINYSLYHQAGRKPEVQAYVQEVRKSTAGCRLILSCDRLDYSKGILHRLMAYDLFLKSHPEYHGKVSMMMVVVPSRDKVEKYAELKRRIDEKIGEINGAYSRLGWLPIRYIYRALPFAQLMALYKLCDIALVTPLRDGMNLVAKEYVASKTAGDPAVLILSEMAGASVELKEAVIVNPNDLNQIEKGLEIALKMPMEEQQRRLVAMQHIVSTYDVRQWAADFMKEWSEVIERNLQLAAKIITPERTESFHALCQKADHRLFVLDYDGTLVGFQDDPLRAVPTSELIVLLKKMTEDDRNTVVINSGRDHEIMENWLGNLPVDIAAEHGAFLKKNGVWTKRFIRHGVSDKMRKILNLFVCKTPGSRLEVKETSLAWHYREVDSWLGDFRSRQLMNALMPECTKYHLQIMAGNKVVELKPSSYNKGTVVTEYLSEGSYGFVFAIGDDTTDEDMYRALPDTGISVNVGPTVSRARYSLKSQKEVLSFLNRIIQ